MKSRQGVRRPVRAASEAREAGRRPCARFRFSLWVQGHRVCKCGWASVLHEGGVN
jgi:hypothetical protein